MVECLNNLLTCHHFLDITVNRCDRLLLTAEVSAGFLADDLDGIEDEEAEYDDDKEQLS